MIQTDPLRERAKSYRRAFLL